MPNEPLARVTPLPQPSSEDDYQALCAALSHSRRGRAFLAEYVRRNRNAETAALLAAIERLQAHLRADACAVERLRDDLRMLLIAIRIVRPEIDAAVPAAAKAQKLAALLDLLERRIDAMAEAKPAEPGGPSAATAGGDARPDNAPEPPRTHLAVVPRPDEPELPIPSPAGAPAPKVVAPAEKAPAPPLADPLAAIMALSEDERLALFT
jgi:hypothetical protein